MQLTVIIYFEIQVFWVNTDEYFQILLHLSHRCLQDYISLQKLISPVLSNGEIHYSKGNWISEQSKIFTTLLICFNSEFQLMIKRQRYFCSSSSIPHITLWWIYQLSFVVLNWLKKFSWFFLGAPVFRCIRDLIILQLFNLAKGLCHYRQEGSATGKMTNDCGVTSCWLLIVKSLRKAFLSYVNNGKNIFH